MYNNLVYRPVVNLSDIRMTMFAACRLKIILVISEIDVDPMIMGKQIRHCREAEGGGTVASDLHVSRH